MTYKLNDANSNYKGLDWVLFIKYYNMTLAIWQLSIFLT
jgi:hypothetical protein